MRVREFQQSDWAELWPIIREVAWAGETFTYDPAMGEDQGYQAWVWGPPGNTVVAVDDERVLGSAKMGPNRDGPGAHVSTASFMVSTEARGRGVGRQLCEFVLHWARESGYAGMQFNAVVESNHAAVELYEWLGFDVIGTVPDAFAHPTLGRVGLHIMYCRF